MRISMRQLGVGMLTLGAGLGILVGETPAANPAMFRRTSHFSGQMRPTVMPPAAAVRPQKPFPRPRPTPGPGARPPRTRPDNPRPRPPDTPGDRSGRRRSGRDGNRHVHDGEHRHHGDQGQRGDRGQRGYSWWWVSGGNNSSGGSPGGGSSSSSATTSPGEHTVIPSYDGNLVGQLQLLELMTERAERRKSDQQPAEGRNDASRQGRRVNPYEEELRKILDHPSSADLYSAKSLNDLLRDVQDFGRRNVRGPKVPLEKDVLRSVNLVSAKDTRSPAVVKHDGKLSYPEALRTSQFKAHREVLDTLLPQAIRQARQGGVDRDQLKEMQEAATRIEEELARARREEQSDLPRLPTTDYIKAKRLVTQLQEALRVLGEPDAENYFNGRYAARGETVAELVEHMTKQGLKFAPAVTGDEAGYENLHRALATYVVATLDSLHGED